VYGFQQEVLLTDKPPVTQVWGNFFVCEVSGSLGCVAESMSILVGGAMSLGEWVCVLERAVWLTLSVAVSL
jgi:hypothetical protein